jgi:hypothetical protein
MARIRMTGFHPPGFPGIEQNGHKRVPADESSEFTPQHAVSDVEAGESKAIGAQRTIARSIVETRPK